MDFTGRDTSMTASSWAWALGPAGATATAGVAIVSVTVVEEAIVAAVAKQQVAAIMHAAAGQCAPTAAVRLTIM